MDEDGNNHQAAKSSARQRIAWPLQAVGWQTRADKGRQGQTHAGEEACLAWGLEALTEIWGPLLRPPQHRAAPAVGSSGQQWAAVGSR